MIVLTMPRPYPGTLVLLDADILFADGSPTAVATARSSPDGTPSPSELAAAEYRPPFGDEP